jgi:hypothetical protein
LGKQTENQRCNRVNTKLYKKASEENLRAQIHRVVYKVHSRRGVYGWNPYQASPAYIETSWRKNHQKITITIKPGQ